MHYNNTLLCSSLRTSLDWPQRLKATRIHKHWRKFTFQHVFTCSTWLVSLSQSLIGLVEAQKVDALPATLFIAAGCRLQVSIAGVCSGHMLMIALQYQVALH